MNIYDCLIAVLSLIEYAFLSQSKFFKAFRTVRIFRSIRVLRVTRILRSLKFMKYMMRVISESISSIIYISLLLMLFIFIYSLLGMKLFSGQFHTDIRQNFDSFHHSIMTVFQILTLESWQLILFQAMLSDVLKLVSLIYLVSWIFLGNYVLLNLFLAILLEGFTLSKEELNLDDDDDEDFTKIDKFKISSSKNTQESDSDDELLVLAQVRKEKKNDYFEDVKCKDSFFIFSKKNIIRQIMYKIINMRNFDSFILFLIFLSSIKLSIDKSINEINPEIYNISQKIDTFFTIAFIIEAFIKACALGFLMDKGSYLRESWNVLDFLIVCISLIDLNLQSVDLPALKVLKPFLIFFYSLKILRLLRILRPLRFISHNLNMKIVVTALLESVGAIFNVLIVVVVVWFLFFVNNILIIF